MISTLLAADASAAAAKVAGDDLSKWWLLLIAIPIVVVGYVLVASWWSKRFRRTTERKYARSSRFRYIVAGLLIAAVNVAADLKSGFSYWDVFVGNPTTWNLLCFELMVLCTLLVLLVTLLQSSYGERAQRVLQRARAVELKARLASDAREVESTARVAEVERQLVRARTKTRRALGGSTLVLSALLKLFEKRTKRIRQLFRELDLRREAKKVAPAQLLAGLAPESHLQEILADVHDLVQQRKTRFTDEHAPAAARVIDPEAELLDLPAAFPPLRVVLFGRIAAGPGATHYRALLAYNGSAWDCFKKQGAFYSEHFTVPPPGTTADTALCYLVKDAQREIVILPDTQERRPTDAPFKLLEDRHTEKVRSLCIVKIWRGAHEELPSLLLVLDSPNRQYFSDQDEGFVKMLSTALGARVLFEAELFALLLALGGNVLKEHKDSELRAAWACVPLIGDYPSALPSGAARVVQVRPQDGRPASEGTEGHVGGAPTKSGPAGERRPT